MKALRALFGVFIVVGAIYLGWQLLPPYMANYQLEDAMTSEARLNTYTPKSEQDIRDSVFKKAQELEIPLTPEQIQVRRTASEISISAEYTVHVDLPGYPLNLKFAPSTKNKRI